MYLSKIDAIESLYSAQSFNKKIGPSLIEI